MRHKSTWTPLVDYEGHEVNTRGEVRNVRTGNILRTSVNQTGVRYVSIRNTKEGKYQNKSIAVLVAETFCPRSTPLLDTVLHLDGDVGNVHAENLMWANRWHAIQFHKEIQEQRFNVRRRIFDENGVRYGSLAEAARATGALPSAIDYAIRYNDNLAQGEHINFTQRVSPGDHIFRSLPI